MPIASAVDWFVAAFVAAALLSLLVSEYPKQSLRELRWLIVEPIAIFYLARATVTTPHRAALTLWALAAAGVLASLASLGSLAAAGQLLDPAARGAAPFLSPNHLGLFLTRALAAALALGLFINPGRAGIGSWLGVAAILLGIARGLSVGAWVGSAAAILVIGGVKSRRGLILGLLAAAAAIAAVVVVIPLDRFASRLDPESGTALFRLQVWAAAINMVRDHPLLGIGLDNFLYLYRQSYMLPEAWREPNLSHPHNLVLHFWLELGLLGLAAMAALMIWAVRASLNLVRPRNIPADRALGAATLGVIGDMLTHGMFDNSYFLVDLAAVWWILLALLVVRSAAAEQEGTTYNS